VIVVGSSRRNRRGKRRRRRRKRKRRKRMRSVVYLVGWVLLFCHC